MMSGLRELKTFPLKPSVLCKLTGAGFSCVGDLATIKPSELSTEASITPTEALDVLKTVFEDVEVHCRKQIIPPSRSALDLLREEQDQRSIVTLCESLDDLIGGGVPLCKITEFCGAPGIGKTQICMQLAVDAHIPECFGGLAGEAVYIDTEGSFIVERVVDIAQATLQHCTSIVQQNGEDNAIFDCLSVDKILSGTHYYRCQDHLELIATIHLLPKFLKQHERVRLVIVDSIACPFRCSFSDMSVRTRLLTMLAQSLIKIATQFRVAVVLTNQMTTKFSAGPGNSYLIPALGESWSHASTIRVVLFWEDNKRKALLYKSPNKQEASCTFQITMGGVRDIVQDNLQQDSGVSNNQDITYSSHPLFQSTETDEETSGLPAKKQRKM